MKKRLVALIATAALGSSAAFGLAACGDDEGDSTTVEEVESVVSEVTEATETAETEGTTSEETTTESGDDSGGSSGLGY